MGLLDRLRKKQTQIIVESEPVLEESFIERAEKAALIVSESVENGQIEEVGDRLRECIGTYSEKEKTVFSALPITLWIFMFFTGILCSAGFLFFMPVTLGTIAYSVTYKQYGLFILLSIAVVILVNVLLCVKAVREIRYSKRYEHYQNAFKYRNTEIVEDLADMISVPRQTVEKDLKKAVKLKLMPQGHFGKDNLFFMVTDEVFAKYNASKAAYDRYFKKVIEERSRMKTRTKETEELLSLGEEYIGKIRDSNDIIKDKDVTGKLDRMESVISAIFHEVDVNPAQAAKLGVFINYYLPTTEKLLTTYIDIEEKQVKGKNLQKTQRDIRNALDSINNAFEALLERFYEEQEIDVASEISAMEIIMKQEGLQTEGDE